MSAADIIILVLVILAVGGIIAFTCFRKKKSPCSHCPYKKDCDSHCTTGKKKNKGKKNRELSIVDIESKDENSSNNNITNILDDTDM